LKCGLRRRSRFRGRGIDHSYLRKLDIALRESAFDGPDDAGWCPTRRYARGGRPNTKEASLQLARALTMLVALFLFGTLAHAEADGPDLWDVSNVASNDVLNMHVAPSANSKVVATIPHNARGLRNLGCNIPSFSEWQKMTEVQRSAAGERKWCKVEYQGKQGWVAGRFLVESAGGGGAANFGGWRLVCDNGNCQISQAGIPSSVVLSVLPVESEYALVLARKALPKAGTVAVYMDGDEIARGEIAPLRNQAGDRLLFGPDDLSAHILKNMATHQNMVVSLPDYERGVEFKLQGFAEAFATLKSKR
jgi:hypothetical protein